MSDNVWDAFPEARDIGRGVVAVGRLLLKHPVLVVACLVGGATAALWAVYGPFALAGGIALMVGLAFGWERWRNRRAEPAPDARRVVQPRRLAVAPEPVENLASITVGETVESRPQPWAMAVWVSGVGSLHWLIAGVTRSGKSNLVWSLVHAIAPWIRSGHVALWGIDPKRGAELGRATAMFTDLALIDERKMDDKGEKAAKLLERAVAEMDQRYDSMAARGVSVHTPTPEEPLIVVWLDEVAQTLTVPNTAIRKRINLSYEWLLRQGAAAGIAVWSITQDPRKEILDQRALMSAGVMFRAGDDLQPDMVLRKGARAMGATADLIAEDERGVAFVRVGGDRPYKVKAARVTPETVTAMNEEFPAPSREAA